MDNYLYPRLKRDAQPLEVVDRHNRPLCILARKDVLRQQLMHRAAALLIRDTAGRALLTLHPGLGWGFSSFRVVEAGLALEAAAWRMLHEDWHLDAGRMAPLGMCLPCPENRLAFTSLFEVRLPVPLALEKAADRERHMLLDYDELKGMGAHFGEMFSPFLRVAVQGGYVRPR